MSEDPQFLNELSRGLFFLGPPTRAGLRDAMVQPAEMAGYRFEMPSIVDEMLHHLESTPGALPLLQFTAWRLWEARDPTRKLLTEQSYREIGGIAGALASHADRVIGALRPKEQACCRSLFLSLVTEDRTRAIRDRNELLETAKDKSELEHLIRHLVASRLLVVQTNRSSTTVEIVHESSFGPGRRYGIGWTKATRKVSFSNNYVLQVDSGKRSDARAGCSGAGIWWMNCAASRGVTEASCRRGLPPLSPPCFKSRRGAHG